MCRTNAVVDATTDKNTAPKSKPDTSTTDHHWVSAGRMVATPNKAFSVASGRPSWCLSSKRAQMRLDAITATPSKA